MRRLVLLVLALALPGASPAGAVTLVVDPAASRIAPAGGGAATPLSGAIEIALGPGNGLANRTFDVVGLDLATTAGLRIGLDPDAPGPGLGVAAFETANARTGVEGWRVLIGTLLLRVEDGAAVFDLAIPDLPGLAAFRGIPRELRSLRTAFRIQTDGGQILDVQLLAAVPEPGAALLLAAPLALVAARRARRS